MTQPIRPGGIRTVTLCGLLTVSAGPLWAQDAQKLEGGAHSTITTSIGVEAGRNLNLRAGNNDNEAQLYGALGYAYEMRTRQSQLSFNAQIQPQTDDDGRNGLYPQASLKWGHEAARIRFNVSADYAEAEITDQSIGFDETTGQIIDYNDTGTRVRRRASATVEGGVDMPFGYTIKVDRSEMDYRDTAPDSDSAANNSSGVQADLRANVSSMTQLTLGLTHRRYEADGAQALKRTTDMVTVGVQQRLNALTMVTGSVGTAKIETDRQEQNQSVDGMVLILGVQRADPLGMYRIDFTQSQTENGRRSYFTLGREYETTVGKFNGAFGASKGVDSGTDWIGTLSYSQDLLRDRLSANLIRSIQTDDDGEDVVLTRLSGSIAHKLSEVNALNFGLTASSTEYPDSDRQRLDATVSYEHMLTQTVSLEAGVKLGMATESNAKNANSQSLFLTVSRSFDFLH